PPLKGEVIRRREAAGEAGVRVVDEDAVAVADDPVGIEEKAIGNRAAVVVALGVAHPAQDAVVGAQLARTPLGLVLAVRAFGIHQRLKGVRLEQQRRLVGPGRGGQEQGDQTERGTHWQLLRGLVVRSVSAGLLYTPAAPQPAPRGPTMRAAPLGRLLLTVCCLGGPGLLAAEPAPKTTNDKIIEIAG